MRWQGNLLYVRDLEDSVHFYAEVLGLPVVARPAPHMAIIRLGNGVLYLHEDPENAPEWMNKALDANLRGVGVICHIEVDDVATLKHRLVSSEVEISQGPIEARGQLQLYVYDPSGYNLVFVQHLSG